MSLKNLRTAPGQTSAETATDKVRARKYSSKAVETKKKSKKSQPKDVAVGEKRK
jgi:hypothetical protein